MPAGACWYWLVIASACRCMLVVGCALKVRPGVNLIARPGVKPYSARYTLNAIRIATLLRRNAQKYTVQPLRFAIRCAIRFAIRFANRKYTAQRCWKESVTPISDCIKLRAMPIRIMPTYCVFLLVPCHLQLLLLLPMQLLLPLPLLLLQLLLPSAVVAGAANAVALLLLPLLLQLP